LSEIIEETNYFLKVYAARKTPKEILSPRKNNIPLSYKIKNPSLLSSSIMPKENTQRTRKSKRKINLFKMGHQREKSIYSLRN
jgi:hypothetical protein